MYRNCDFKAWFLEDNRYVNYVNELDIYSGLSRNYASINKDISDRTNQLH